MSKTVAKNTHPFETFLHSFIDQVSRKSKQLNQAAWLLETTGLPDAASLKGSLDADFRLLFSDPEIYQNLLKWEKDASLTDPLLRRQLDILIRGSKQNQLPKELLRETAEKEAALAQTYATFRPEIDGKKVSENDLREILKKENDPEKRKKAWEASKEVGKELAPQILHLVHLRNKGAQALGYPDYFQMQLELQEVDALWLLKTLDALSTASDAAYSQVIQEINSSLSKRFHTSSLGPWAWSDPFCQEDPFDNQEFDQLVCGVDIEKASLNFYRNMGVDVEPILARSDMLERPGKNQHAFCINMDREGDIRTLNNVKPSLKWLEVVLHELGHAIYEVGLDPELPWLLREPPHMITTEAMALIAGRQAYMQHPLRALLGKESPLLLKADASHRRRQLIFSRWVLVMTAFESELYRDPTQPLNALWWKIVEKYQKIPAPPHRENQYDWATKYHMGLAPVYYFSYLLGEMFASSIQETILRECGTKTLSTKEAGQFLEKKLFRPGNRMSWSELVKHVTGAPLNANAWLKEYATP